jgi:hypothetical protein
VVGGGAMIFFVMLGFSECQAHQRRAQDRDHRGYASMGFAAPVYSSGLPPPRKNPWATPPRTYSGGGPGV